MNAASQRRLTPLLATVTLLLGALWLSLLFGFGSGVRWDAPRAATLPPLSSKQAGLPVPAPPEEFVPVWQQSLFSPARRPEAHAVSGGSNLGDLKLTGIILTPQLHMALLHDNSGDKELRVREGESLPDGSASVVEVKQRSVILDSPQGRTELKLPAGAPITMNGPVPPAASPGAPGNGDMPPPSSGPGQPPQAPMSRFNPQQSERLQKLRAAILQHRATGQAGNPEGAH